MSWHGQEWYEKLDAVHRDICEALEQYNDPNHNSYHVTMALEIALKNVAELRQGLDAFFTGTKLRQAVCPRCSAGDTGTMRGRTFVSGGD
jgi:hypothetical protein